MNNIQKPIATRPRPIRPTFWRLMQTAKTVSAALLLYNTRNPLSVGTLLLYPSRFTLCVSRTSLFVGLNVGSGFLRLMLLGFLACM